MLQRIDLKFGPAGYGSRLSVNAEGMTLFVGPNGSGKSLVLRELQVYAESGPQAGRQIVDGIVVKFPDAEEAKAILSSRTVQAPSSPMREGFIEVTKTVPGSANVLSVHLREAQLLAQLTDGRQSQLAGTISAESIPSLVFQWFTNLFTVALDGKSRFVLVEERQAGDLQRAPNTHLDALFQNDKARSRVREIIEDAFEGLYFVIDPTHLGKLRIRMSHRPPADPQEEQAVDRRAREFHAAAADIADLSDGVKAFTGLVSALMSSDFRIVFVDEPEAFLHPPLARKLGNRMASLAAERDASVFSATHSADFLMGCVESGRRVNIVRLTYEPGKATARLLGSEDLTMLMRDPLLRSTGVLSALFHTGAVVGESEKDRAFYQEINSRLLAGGVGGVKDSVFLHAQNKQTVRRIVQPLRAMGIPAAAVVDFDIIKGTDLRDLLNACGVPPDIVHSLGILRGNVETHFRTSKLDMKEGGINLLNGDKREACESLLSQLRVYGIFVVPNGEVESWLPSLEIEATKQDWLPAIFEKMGSNPDDSGYLRPGAGDIWDFIRAIEEWVHNPRRLGMPQ